MAEYWRHAWQVREPWAIGCPATEEHIPIGLHGDSARLWSQNKFEKVMAVTLNICLFRPRSVRFSRWCLFSCPHHLVYKNRTLNAFWRRIAWSLEHAFQGVHPLSRPGGKPLLTKRERDHGGQQLSSSGARWALTECRGDWEWHVQVFRPKASWQATKVCFRCPAQSKDNHLYWAHGDDCTWESAEYGLQAFISQRLKENNLCALDFPKQ